MLSSLVVEVNDGKKYRRKYKRKSVEIQELREARKGKKSFEENEKVVERGVVQRSEAALWIPYLRGGADKDFILNKESIACMSPLIDLILLPEPTGLRMPFFGKGEKGLPELKKRIQKWCRPKCQVSFLFFE